MTADEMFEELGYTKHENNFGIFYYDKEDIYEEKTTILFDKEDKTIHFDTYITMQELKAINEKVKELGWLDKVMRVEKITNAEKYLTVSTKEFKNAIINTQGDIGGLYSLEKWLDTEVKPTLTEDERVILKNISDTFNTIKRNNYGFLELYDICLGEWKECQFKDNLFQFIKERRRIRDKGVIGRKMTEYYIKYYKEHKKEILERVKKYYTKNKDKILSQRRKNSSRAEQIFLQDKKLKGSTILEIIRAKPKRYICMCNCGSKFEITSKRMSVLLMQDKFIVCQKCRTEKAKDKRQKVRKVAYT